MNTLSSLYETTSSIPIQMTHIDVVKRYLDRQLSYNDCFPDNYLVELHKVALSDSFLWLTIKRANELIKEALDYGEIATPNRILGTLCLENLVDEINNSSRFSIINEIKFQEIISSFFQFFKKQVDLSDYFLQESHVSFHPEKERYMRTLVVDKKEGDKCTIYTIGWKPGDKTTAHHHGNDRDAIIVLDGCLTQYLYDSKEPSAYSSPVKQTFSKGEIICVEPNRCHKLVNEDSFNLRTLHIRVEDKCRELQEGLKSRYIENIYGDPFWNTQWACFLDDVRHLKHNLCF